MSSATEELARRRRVRGSLEELSKLCGFTPAQHHSYIMRHLEQVTRGELDRLLTPLPAARKARRPACSSRLTSWPTTRQRRSSPPATPRRSRSASAGVYAT